MAAKRSGGGRGGSKKPSGKTKAPFTPEGIKSLRADKPVVYDLLGKSGKVEYTGSAKKGNVPERLLQHSRSSKGKGILDVRITQKSSIADARKAEAAKIKRDQPPRNKQGK